MISLISTNYNYWLWRKYLLSFINVYNNFLIKNAYKSKNVIFLLFKFNWKCTFHNDKLHCNGSPITQNRHNKINSCAKQNLIYYIRNTPSSHAHRQPHSHDCFPHSLAARVAVKATLIATITRLSTTSPWCFCNLQQYVPPNVSKSVDKTMPYH